MAASIGYWIAHGAFWVLLAFTAVELRARRVALFVALWLVGYALLHWLQAAFAFATAPEQGAMLFMSYVAVLDIVLVLLVFKGDIRLT